MQHYNSILIADASPLYRQGLKLAIEGSDLKVNTRSAAQLGELEQQLEMGHKTRVVLIDARLPGLETFSQLKELSERYSVPLLLLAEVEDPALVRRAMFSGAHGVISKGATPEQLMEAVTQIYAGGYWRSAQPLEQSGWQEPAYFAYALKRLSNRERNVLNLVRSGLRNKQIASQMKVTEHTIKSHMSSILRKLNIENRTRLVMAMQQVPEEGLQLQSA